jgi:outer membrane immunogenic protein
MKKHLLAGVALAALIAGPAIAADLPVRAPAYAPPPPAVVYYNWTGCYIGANVGGGWTKSNTFGYPLPDPVTAGFVPMDVGTNGSGVVAGGQAGCNLQVASNFVVGIEGDFSWSGVKGEGTVGPIESTPVPGLFPGSFATSTHEVAWVGTLRGRAGVAFDRLMIYVTGGLAWASLKTTADEVFLTPVSNPGSFDSTRIGWVGGVGLEYAVTYNWIVRGEYLYHQFAGDTFIGARLPVLAGAGVEYTTGRTNLSVARLALSYKFGAPPPVINYSK